MYIKLTEHCKRASVSSEILTKENETVVENVLEEETEWVQSNAADRVASFLPGAKSDALSVAVEPIVAATNGFFVALFNKKKR